MRYNRLMSVSERLQKMIEVYFEGAGKNASSKLCVAANCAQRTIYAIKNEGHVPTPAIAYKLAKACGHTDKEALKLSQEVLALEVAETA